MTEKTKGKMNPLAAMNIILSWPSDICPFMPYCPHIWSGLMAASGSTRYFRCPSHCQCFPAPPTDPYYCWCCTNPPILLHFIVSLGQDLKILEFLHLRQQLTPNSKGESHHFPLKALTSDLEMPTPIPHTSQSTGNHPVQYLSIYLSLDESRDCPAGNTNTILSIRKWTVPQIVQLHVTVFFQKKFSSVQRFDPNNLPCNSHFCPVQNVIRADLTNLSL